jgi:hypothetical protein
MRRPVFSVLGNSNHAILEKPNVDPDEPKRVEGVGEKRPFVVVERTWWKRPFVVVERTWKERLLLALGGLWGERLLLALGGLWGKIIVSVGKHFVKKDHLLPWTDFEKRGWSGK